MGVSVSTDDALLDVDLIHRWLSEDAYWALGRSRETVEVSLRHSVNVGAYDDGRPSGRLPAHRHRPRDVRLGVRRVRRPGRPRARAWASC